MIKSAPSESFRNFKAVIVQYVIWSISVCRKESNYFKENFILPSRALITYYHLHHININFGYRCISWVINFYLTSTTISQIILWIFQVCKFNQCRFIMITNQSKVHHLLETFKKNYMSEMNKIFSVVNKTLVIYFFYYFHFQN